MKASVPVYRAKTYYLGITQVCCHNFAFLWTSNPPMTLAVWVLFRTSVFEASFLPNDIFND